MKEIDVNLRPLTQNINAAAAPHLEDIDINVRPLVKNISVAAAPKLQDIQVEMRSNILFAFSPIAKVEQLSNGNYLISITDKNGTTTAEIPYPSIQNIDNLVDEYLNNRSVIQDFIREYNNSQESRQLIKELILDAVSDLQAEVNNLKELIKSIKVNNLAFKVDTKENWDAQRDLVSDANTVYFYRNFKTIQLDNNTFQNIPGIKLGDGSAFLIDLPFISDPTPFWDHINDQVRHITDAERMYWNDKVGCEAGNENLIFYK